MKILPLGAKLFRADGRTDMTKLIFAFRNFENAPQNVFESYTQTHQTTCVCACLLNTAHHYFKIQFPRKDLVVFTTKLVTTDAKYKELQF